MSWKRSGDLLRKLLTILSQHPEGLKASEALAKVADGETLTEFEASFYPNGGERRFENIIRWSTVDLVKAGWLHKQKGVWLVTGEGRQALTTFPDPEAFAKEATRLYLVWKGAQTKDAAPNSTAGPEVQAETGDKATTVSFEQAEEQAWNEIEAHLGAMPPYDFQNLVADLLKAMGYYPSWVAPPGPDGGLDIIAYPDPLGTRPPRIKVQVKRQQQRVSADGVRSFIALINEDDAGLFVNLGGFTRDADDAARRQERRKITLIDFDRLVELWIEFYGKLEPKARERMPLTPIYFLTPRE